MSTTTHINENLGELTNLNGIEYSRIENDVFMSFVEEPQFEASDEELLRSVIESETIGANTNDSNLLEQMEIQDSTNLSCIELDCWIDLDMDCSTTNDDHMNIWFKDCYSHENGVEDEFSWEESCYSMLYE